jgi:tellurite resistance protein TehA-like permease
MSAEEDPNHGWRKVARNSSPAWSTVTMGTGIVSILLYELPYNGRWLCWLSVITFCLNILLFLLASLASVLRYVIWPEMWALMMRHPNQLLFLAATPMVRRSNIFSQPRLLTRQGLGTIIQMVVFICSPIWGTYRIIWHIVSPLPEGPLDL